MTNDEIINKIEENLSIDTIVIFSDKDYLDFIREAYIKKHVDYKKLSKRMVTYEKYRITFGHEDNKTIGCGRTFTSAIFIDCSDNSTLYNNILPSLDRAKATEVWIRR